MSNAKDGVKRLGTLFTTVGVIGSVCAAIVLYSLEFHLTLRVWVERLVSTSQQLLASPDVITQAKLAGLGLIMAGGSAVLLATGLGILIGAQAIREAKQVRMVPGPAAGGAALPRTSR